MKKIVISIVILAVAVGGALIFLGRKTSAPATNNTATNSESSTNPEEKTSTVESAAASDDTTAAAVITYSNNGFSTTPLTVKSGETVEIKNTSSHVVQLDSDPHPVHTDDADLNVGLIPAGQSKKFTLTKKGTWGYHNHLNSSETGSVTVQ